MLDRLSIKLLHFAHEANASLSRFTSRDMTQATDRRARRAGMTIKKCRRGTVYTDPVTGESVYNGNRSRKSPRYERCVESFVRRHDRGGLN